MGEMSMKFINRVVFAFCLTAALGAYGQDRTAVETAEVGVQTLLQTIAANEQYFASDRSRYFNAIEQVLESFVDFDAVATVVMSRYAQQASQEQITRFGEILKSTLTRFYGASMVDYTNEELVFLPERRQGDSPRSDRIVSMELRGDSQLRVQYQMFLNDNDEWKLKNINLAGINLGRQYYSQFSALMSEYNNDIDQVLANWQ